MTRKQNQFKTDNVHLISDINRDYLKDVLGDRIATTARIGVSEVSSKEQEWRQKMYKVSLLGSIALMTMYEWGPGNEIVAGHFGVNAQQAWSNPDSLSTLLTSSLAVGATTAAILGIQQTASGLLMANGVRQFPKSFKYLDDTKKIETSALKKQRGSLVTAYALGTSAAILQQNYRDPERTLKKDVKFTLGITAVVGAIDTSVFSVVSAGVQTLDATGHGTAADWIERIAQNPLTYIGGFAAIKTFSHIRGKQKFKKYNQPLPVD